MENNLPPVRWYVTHFPFDEKKVDRIYDEFEQHINPVKRPIGSALYERDEKGNSRTFFAVIPIQVDSSMQGYLTANSFKRCEQPEPSTEIRFIGGDNLWNICIDNELS
jgi:hypothetical protein